MRAVLEQRQAWAVAAEVVDPEMPMLTLADLGVLRAVDTTDDGAVVVTITPTYSGCPATAAMRDDLVRRLRAEGFDDVRVRIALHPAWTTDWITARGRAALAAAGVSPPGPARVPTGSTTGSPVPLTLQPVRRRLTCPRCHDSDVEPTSEFGPTACTALYRCRACGEPFEHMKEH